MTLQAAGDLAAAEVAFYSIAFCFGLFVVFRHGFSRQLGWFYIVVLSILRLVGGSATLYLETHPNHQTIGLYTTAAITSSVGTAPLLLALMGFMSRVQMGMSQKALPNLAFRGISLVGLVALILAIIGGTDVNSTPPDPAGKPLIEAASILFLAVYLVIAGITVLTFKHKEYTIPGERKLIYAGMAAIPFLLVRILFTVLVSFSATSTFTYGHVDVWAEAFMQFLMEAIVVTIFCIAGILTPKAQPMVQTPSDGYRKPASNDVEMNNGYESQGYTSQQPQQPHREPRNQQPRNLGDYRPSRLIRNAISGR